MNVNPRSSWTDRKITSPSRKPTPYKGVAVHWPGLSGQLNLDTHPRCLDLLRTLERNAVNSGEYGAIPYQVAACAHGLTEGRTVLTVNGANGSTEANAEFGSCVVLIGTADDFTDAHKRAVRASLSYLNGPKLLTHNEVRPSPTACPGPAITKWIGNGAPAPGPKPDPTEDDLVRYLSLAAPDPQPIPPNDWTTLRWPVEHADDWTGHKGDSGVVTLPKGGVVAGGVTLTSDVALSVRFRRGPEPDDRVTVAASEDGPGPVTLALPPALSRDTLVVQVRAAIPANVSAAALRLTHSARVKP